MTAPTPNGPWARLGLAPTDDTTAIRRAYARELKQVHPEDDPEGFQALRAAYEAALQQATWMAEDAAAEAEEAADDAPAEDPDTANTGMDHSGADSPHRYYAVVPPAEGGSPHEGGEPPGMAHADLLEMEEALQALIQTLEGPAPGDDEVRRRLDAVLDALQRLPVDLVAYFTDSIVHAVLESDARVDAHLTHLQRRLGWDRTDVLVSWNHFRERLSQRIGGRDFLLSVRIPNAPLAPVWALLNEANPWRRTLQLMRHPKRAPAALALLERLEHEAPYARDELPEASVAYWERWRDVGVWRPWVFNFMAAFAALALLGLLGGDRKEPGLVWGGFALGTGVLGLLWLHGVERPAKRGMALPRWLRGATALGMFLWPVLVGGFEPLPATAGPWLALVFLPLLAGGWILAVTRPQGAGYDNPFAIRQSLLVNLFWIIGVGLWLLALASPKDHDTQSPSPTLLSTLAVAVLALAAIHGETLRQWFRLADQLRFRMLAAIACWCVVMFAALHAGTGHELAPTSRLALAVLTSLAVRSLLYPGMDAVKFRGWMSAAAFVAGWFAHARLALLTGAPRDFGPAAGLLVAALFEVGHHAWALRRETL